MPILKQQVFLNKIHLILNYISKINTIFLNKI